MTKKELAEIISCFALCDYNADPVRCSRCKIRKLELLHRFSYVECEDVVVELALKLAELILKEE